MTTFYRKFLERSRSYLRRILRKPAWDFNRFLTGPRRVKGRRWRWQTSIPALLCGFLTNRESVRAVESLTKEGFDQYIPDLTLDNLVGKFSGNEVAELRRQPHTQIPPVWRRQSLGPVGLPWGMVAVDHTT